MPHLLLFPGVLALGLLENAETSDQLVAALEALNWTEDQTEACRGLAALARSFLLRENLLSAHALAVEVNSYCREAYGPKCASCPLQRLRAWPSPLSDGPG